MEPKVVVGRNIREHRHRLKLTQEVLADRSGIHVTEIRRAEYGVRDMRVSTIAKIAAGLGVPAADLLRGV
jgi:transcriptional regulator with XRE-family HTH domain